MVVVVVLALHPPPVVNPLQLCLCVCDRFRFHNRWRRRSSSSNHLCPSNRVAPSGRRLAPEMMMSGAGHGTEDETIGLAPCVFQWPWASSCRHRGRETRAGRWVLAEEGASAPVSASGESLVSGLEFVCFGRLLPKF